MSKHGHFWELTLYLDPSHSRYAGSPLVPCLATETSEPRDRRRIVLFRIRCTALEVFSLSPISHSLSQDLTEPRSLLLVIAFARRWA